MKSLHVRPLGKTNKNIASYTNKECWKKEENYYKLLYYKTLINVTKNTS